MRKAVTIALNRPDFRRHHYDSCRISGLGGLGLTNTRKPLESCFQVSVKRVSYSSASFIYEVHIPFTESSRATEEWVERKRSIVGFPTYLREQWDLRGKARKAPYVGTTRKTFLSDFTMPPMGRGGRDNLTLTCTVGTVKYPRLFIGPAVKTGPRGRRNSYRSSPAMTSKLLEIGRVYVIGAMHSE